MRSIGYVIIAFVVSMICGFWMVAGIDGKLSFDIYKNLFAQSLKFSLVVAFLIGLGKIFSSNKSV